MGVLIREMPLLASALFGPIHAIICKIIVSNHRGMFLSSILENTCLKKRDVLFVLADLCKAELITLGPHKKPCKCFWIACTDIDIQKSCPAHLYELLNKRIERTRCREQPRCFNSSKKALKRYVPHKNTSFNIKKKGAYKRFIHRR